MNLKPSIALDAYPMPAQGAVGGLIQSAPEGGIEAVLVLPNSGKVEVFNEIWAKI